MENKKILIVEDERVVAEDIKNSLEDLGYVVTGVEDSGEEAIKKVEENKPDLVMMDIKLKGKMDGIDAASQISSRSNIPIVFLTAHTDEKTLERAKLTEPFGYLVKPFEQQDLQIAIEMALYKWRTERRLKEDEKWFSKLLWSINEAMIATDKNEHILFMNPSAETLTGWNLEDVAGKSLKTIFNIRKNETEFKVGGISRNIVQNDYTEMLGDDIILITKDGIKRDIEKSTSLIKDSYEGIIGKVMIFRDVTEQKQMEKELIDYVKNLENEINQRNAELIFSDKLSSLGLLIVGVAHEINDPLSYIKSNNDFIRERISELKTHFQEDADVKTIRQIAKLINKNLQGIERITMFTKTLQKFANPNTGSKLIVDINREIEDTLLILKSEMRDKIKLNKDYGQIPKIHCDIGKLNQVFMTLILNAVRSTEKGEIWIKTRNDDDFIDIEIEDNGGGMPERDVDKILDTLSTTKYKGEELSLKLCCRIIKEHNGEFEIESKVGKGTKITIKLPI